MGLWFGQMLYRKSIVEEEAEAIHLAVDKIIDVFTSCYLRIERYSMEHLFVHYHRAAEDKCRSLQPRLGPYDLVETSGFAAKAIPVSHPCFVLNIIIIFTGLVEVVGTFIGYFAVSISSAILPFALAFAGGTMIYVICNEMIPETHSHGSKASISYAFLVGFSLMVAMSYLI
jgi:hypothetical protein